MSFFSKNYRQISDENLMAGISAGDTHAFDELYRRYSQRMLGYFYRMLGGDAEKAQDFLQDLFTKIIDNCDSYRNGARFSTWLFTIAGNMCKNEYRWQAVRRGTVNGFDPDLLPDIGSDIAETIDMRTLRELIGQELEQLDAHQRNAFVLRFQEQLSIKEISAVMKCAEGTTKSRLHYVTRKLAQKFRAYHPEKQEDNDNETHT